MPDWLIILLMPFGAALALFTMRLGFLDLRDKYRALPGWGQALAKCYVVATLAGIVYLESTEDREQARADREMLSRWADQ